MALETSTKHIGSHEYAYHPLSATPAYKLLLKLVKILGPSFAALAGGKEGFAGAAQALSAALDEKSADEIIKQLVQQSEVDGTPLKGAFEIHFAQDMSGLFKFLGFALEAQFGDFLGAMLNAKKALGGATATVATPMTVDLSGQSGAVSSNA